MRRRIAWVHAVGLVLLGGCAAGRPGLEPRLPSGAAGRRAGMTCLDFQAIAPFPTIHPGPTFTIAPLTFTHPTHGSPTPLTHQARSEDHDLLPELYVGFSRSTPGFTPLTVDFPTAVRAAQVELRHFARATVIARDASGAAVATASQPAQNTRAFVSLSGAGITRLEFDAVETLVYQICWM